MCSGGGELEFQFSASADLKREVAEMKSEKYVRIISSAQCQRYRSNIDLARPPPFDPGFIEWANKLADSSASEGDVLQFIKYYGTHFFSDVTFGAKFIQSHKISQADLEKLKKESMSVEAQASYSALFSVGGGSSMDSDQRNAATKFMKNVDCTITPVGSVPPSNGDAATWATSVQSNPVPVMYTLLGIENLFSDHFTRNLSPKVNYVGLKKKLADAAYKHCQVMLKHGKVPSCSFKVKIEGHGIGFEDKGETTLAILSLQLTEHSNIFSPFFFPFHWYLFDSSLHYTPNLLSVQEHGWKNDSIFRCLLNLISSSFHF